MKWHDVGKELPQLNCIEKNDVYMCFTSEDLVLRSIICGQRETYFIGRYVKGPNSNGKVTEGFSCPGKVTHWALLEKVQAD